MNFTLVKNLYKFQIANKHALINSGIGVILFALTLPCIAATVDSTSMTPPGVTAQTRQVLSYTGARTVGPSSNTACAAGTEVALGSNVDTSQGFEFTYTYDEDDNRDWWTWIDGRDYQRTRSYANSNNINGEKCYTLQQNLNWRNTP